MLNRSNAEMTACSCSFSCEPTDVSSSAGIAPSASASASASGVRSAAVVLVVSSTFLPAVDEKLRATIRAAEPSARPEGGLGTWGDEGRGRTKDGVSTATVAATRRAGATCFVALASIAAG